MSYKAIHFFTDLQDFNHPYEAGEVFPRPGMVVSEERIKELLSNKNKQGRAVIQYVDDGIVETVSSEKQYTKTDINRMSTSELKNLAISEMIVNAEYMTGSELKKVLIEHFDL